MLRMQKYCYTILLILVSISCKSPNNKPIISTNHIFYLHGRIIEQQGKEAFSEEFGKYELDSIIASLKTENSTVYCEIRKENVVPRDYAMIISKQIDSLIQLQVNPKNITVIGASKGAIIAATVSDINKNAINYVLLAGNNEYQEQNNDWKFHGQVLCFYEISDGIAGKNYNHWKNKGNYTTTFQQIELQTNLGHGFLYKPLSEWVVPTKKWILTQKL